MVLQLDPRLEGALNEQARQQGMTPEELALHVLQERLLTATNLEPRDEWERGLIEAARPWGVSLSDAALRRDEIYE